MHLYILTVPINLLWGNKKSNIIDAKFKIEISYSAFLRNLYGLPNKIPGPEDATRNSQQNFRIEEPFIDTVQIYTGSQIKQ